MNFRIRYIIWSFLFFSVSCSSEKEDRQLENQNTGFQLITENDSLNYLVLTTGTLKDEWALPYKTYQFQIGDVDKDGNEDALVGVIKTTRFDSTSAKRLFIFKNYKGYVRPMWLGSRMSQPLEDFCFVNGDVPLIRTIEKEKSGKYLVAEYKWRKFGLEFLRYVDREIDKEIAKKKLYN